MNLAFVVMLPFLGAFLPPLVERVTGNRTLLACGAAALPALALAFGGDDGWRYAVGLAVNLAFVVCEFAAGLIADSTALLADAGHNLSDVLGLAMAGGAAWLARRGAHGAAGGRRTYGFGKATVLAALGNAIYDATGVRMTQLPMSPGAVTRALQDREDEH